MTATLSTAASTPVPIPALLRNVAQRLARPAARRSTASLIALAAVLAALPYAPNAEARGGHHRAGFFVGGVVLGAVLAPRYVYSAPYYYYPPPVYYAPYPAQVTYVQPPVVVQQVAPAAPLAAAPQALGIEERLRRLRSMCEQGLFTASECQSRREQMLQEM